MASGESSAWRHHQRQWLMKAGVNGENGSVAAKCGDRKMKITRNLKAAKSLKTAKSSAWRKYRPVASA
jgi:hypothetical protein